MEKLKIKIREATIKDISVLKKLQKEFMEYHLKFDSYYKLSLYCDSAFKSHAKHLIESDDNHIIVAVVDAKIVGFASGGFYKRPPIYRVPKTGYIEMAFVRSKYHHRGIGRSLVETICKWLKKGGITLVELGVNYSNAEAIKIWKSLGFKEFSLKMKRKL